VERIKQSEVAIGGENAVPIFFRLYFFEGHYFFEIVRAWRKSSQKVPGLLLYFDVGGVQEGE